MHKLKENELGRESVVAKNATTAADGNRSVIVRCIRNVFQTRELDPFSTCAKNAQVAADGKVRQIDIFNLPLVLFLLTAPN